MIPGNVDPRRPDKVQRYKAPQANGNAPVEDLTPDYMNILGPDSATANAAEASEIVKSAEPQPQQLVQPSQPQQEDSLSSESSIQSTNGTNVIPTSPQYGVAIMSNDVPSEATTGSTDTVVETTAKSEGEGGGGGNNKDMHSTPSRNDRFKVVKIASLEPFRRGRWKCMDYVDENPPPANSQSKSSQSTSNLQMGNNIYLQTQSLPQQHFQQMLVQGNFANAPHYYNVPSQMMPQSQYYYPAQSMQQLPPGAIQPQFINAANQQYFAQNVVPHSAAFSNYTNVQYVPSNLIQNQGSAFVPTTQNVVNSQLPPNFQQSQTYAGPPSGAQPIVNGHAYPPPPSEPQVVVAPSSLPTQVAKNVILTPNANQIPPTIMPTSNNPNMQQQYTNAAAYAANHNITQVVSTVPIVPVVSAQSVNHIPTSVNQVQPMSSVIPQQQHQQQAATTAPVSAATAAAVAAAAVTLPNIIMQQQQPQPYDPNMPTNVYTNPQFVASVNSLPVAAEGVGGEAGDDAGSEATENAAGDDPAKANPVVNAIDNKIEQAMDLVKSHLMYTVREEVEVLKEKIAELMERIQQLETENSFLKQQIPKGTNTNPSGTPDPPQ